MADEPTPNWHGTTILSVRKNGKAVIAGDGQVSVGPTVMKSKARKVRRLADGSVVVGADDGDMIVSDPLPVDADPLPVDPGDSVARLRPHITGIIDTAEFLEEADASGLLGRFLVRGDGSTNYDQAWVEILRDTQISFDGESFAPPTLADLAPGRTVAVIFSGPVRESYPVQAVAGQIVIRR